MAIWVNEADDREGTTLCLGDRKSYGFLNRYDTIAASSSFIFATFSANSQQPVFPRSHLSLSKWTFGLRSMQCDSTEGISPSLPPFDPAAFTPTRLIRESFNLQI